MRLQEVASRHVPLEVHRDVKHNKRGILSMARGDGGWAGQGGWPGCGEDTHAVPAEDPQVCSNIAGACVEPPGLRPTMPV